MKSDTTKRIVYFSDAPYVGGAERYLLLLAVGMKQRGYDITFILNHAERLRYLVSELEREGIDVHRSNLGLPYHLSGLPGFIRTVKDLHPDLFHMNLPGPFDSQYSLVAPLARLAGAKRVVSTEHLPMVEPFFKGRVLKGMASRWIDAVITVSKDNVVHLKRKHGVPEKKIRVVYIGIKNEVRREGDIRMELGMDEGRRLIIMVGSIEERKGHRTAIEAMRLLEEEVHLLVVGKGPDEEELKKTVSDTGLADRVHFLGMRNDVGSLMMQSDVLVLPSTLEATPYVVVEAMAASLPVVASDIYGIGELVENGKTGFLIPPNDSRFLADSVLKILHDEKLRSMMGEEARRRYLEKFTLDHCIEETSAIYEELLSR